MPLNLERTEPAENPEVVEIKRKVLQIAKDHSRRFHCGGGAEQALREAGLEPPEDPRLRIVVTFTIGDVESDTTVEMFESALIDKTEEEQIDLVAQSISSEVYVGDKRVVIPIKVTDLNLEEPPPGVPRGYVLRFTSHEGRVAHIVKSDSTRGLWHHNALCGADSMFGWSNESSRDSGHVCAKCQERARSRL